MDLTGQHILRKVEALLKKRYSEDSELRNGLPWQRIARIVSKALPGRGWQPTQTQAAAFMTRFAASNELVRRNRFVERESLFSEDFSHLPEHAPAVDFEADFNGACAVIVEAVLDAVRQQQMFAKEESVRAARAKQTARERIALSRVVKLDSTDVESRLRLARLQIDEGALTTVQHH